MPFSLKYYLKSYVCPSPSTRSSRSRHPWRVIPIPSSSSPCMKIGRLSLLFHAAASRILNTLPPNHYVCFRFSRMSSIQRTFDLVMVDMAAGAFRALCEHLQQRGDQVQNIDLMTVGGFCRNCLAKVRSELPIANYLRLLICSSYHGYRTFMATSTSVVGP